MYVFYFMTPEPITILPETAVPDAYEMLQEHHFRHLPVVDNDNVLQGMVTDRDLRSAFPSSVLRDEERGTVQARVRATPVSAIMSTDSVSLQPVSTLDDALLLFTARSIGALPVLDSQNRVVGIFSLNDMMAAYRSLFGLGEKGSMLVSIKDPGTDDSLSRLVHALEEKGIDCTRLVRSSGFSPRVPKAIYLRVNTFNLSSVHRVVEQAGFTILTPAWQEEENEKC